MGRWTAATVPALSVLAFLLVAQDATARPAIRSDFFARYPAAVGTAIETVSSNANHCGVCHFNFDGAGARTPYGNDVKARRDAGRTNAQAFQDLEPVDSDGDGATNLTEITDTTNYSNTPTFPGLFQGNKTSAVNVALADIETHLTPITAPDTTPPAVTVSAPNGGETIAAGGLYTITYTATDVSGIAKIDVDLSEDGGSTWEPVARNATPGTSFAWFVPNLPGSGNRIRVVATDNVGNVGQDASNANFTITGVPAGVVPSTLRDLKLAGTQPLKIGALDNPATTCLACHGNYDTAKEPWYK